MDWAHNFLFSCALIFVVQVGVVNSLWTGPIIFNFSCALIFVDQLHPRKARKLIHRENVYVYGITNRLMCICASSLTQNLLLKVIFAAATTTTNKYGYF